MPLTAPRCIADGLVTLLIDAVVIVVVDVAAVMVINVVVAVFIAVVVDVVIDCTTRSSANCVSSGCCTFGSTAANVDEVMTTIIDGVVAIRIDRAMIIDNVVLRRVDDTCCWRF